VIEHVQYAEVDEIHIAYRVLGEAGGHDVVMMSSQFFAVEQLAEDRIARRFIDGVAELGRLVMFDKRGVGLSDPVTDWERPIQAQWAQDLIAVIEATGLVQPTVVSWDPFGVGRLVASLRPELIGKLVLINPIPSASVLAEGIRALPSEEQSRPWALERAAFPSRIDEPGFRTWLERAGRAGASPAVAQRFWAVLQSHAGTLTPTGIRCPTLVLHRARCMASTRVVRDVSDAIVGAHFVQVDGADLYPVAGDVDPLIAEISRFVTGTAASPPPQRVLAAVVFTDLVRSTDQAVRAGDESWSRLLDRHDEHVQACVEQVGGRVIKFTGDGVLAILPSAQAAITATHSIRHRLGALGLRIRAGIHVGDIEQRGDDVAGLAVNIAARIMSEAAADEILVSDSVVSSMLGTNALFDGSRTAVLKGIPGHWTLHRSPAPTP
jgi:class 3 adenylate cyclase